MATKTFKIGLSATDKQNMAQDIYELVVNMCFDEYDSSNTYNQGDFVVYENPTNTFKLYKCIANNVTGAWDNTKWEIAKLQDILDDIENAVQYVNDKANVDGNYPTMTVGVADQLSPYDEDSGDDQDEPFSFQATGTANGTQSDFSTGSIALMKEKQGNTVVVNQWTQPLTSDYWSTYNSSATFSDGIATFTATAYRGSIYFGGLPKVANHTLLFMVDIKLTTATTNVNLYAYGGYVTQDTVATTNWQTIYKIATTNSAWGYDLTNNNQISIEDRRQSDWDAIQVKNAICIDLTQMFNGNIPDDLIANPENFFRYYQGSLAYNEGTLVNANAQYIKCIGRNQFDKSTSIVGKKLASDGTDYTSADNSHSDYIKVIPNATYYAKKVLGGGSSSTNICYYDKDKVFIDKDSFGDGGDYNGTFTVPSNCCYVRIDYLTEWVDQVVISLYYSGESGYDQYYPYEVLTNNDTGTETLRSAGSVKDSKLPSGKIIRRVGVVADMSTLNWQATGNQVYAKVDGMQDNNQSVVNVFCPKWLTANSLDTSAPHILQADGYVNILGMNFADHQAILDATAGVPLYFDLKTPTTEQGTSFSENLLIDDFGSMDFQGTNGVPQGNLIFYPVDYKAFIDTLYNYTEGTPSNIALKSDLTDFLTETKNNSGITAETGITLDIVKLTKISNIVFIDFVIHNSSGSSISANTKILEIASGYRPVNTSYGLFSDHGFEVKANGDITTLEGMSAGQYVEYHGSYQI